MRWRILLLVLLALGVAVPVAAQSDLHRLASEFKFYDNDEARTNLGVPGTVIWQRVFDENPGDDTLYVTISATGDTGNAALWLSCRVNGLLCRPSASPATGVAGWISVVPRLTRSDVSIHYTWCIALTTPGPHTAEISMASSTPPRFVSLESAHFYIDSSETFGGGCVKAEGP
jgi:hypothetical protein